jgi:hypothetical protein
MNLSSARRRVLPILSAFALSFLSPHLAIAVREEPDLATKPRDVSNVSPAPAPTKDGTVFLALSHTDALARAAAENKPLLLVFTGDWSADSRKLLSDTLTSPTVTTFLRERTIALHLPAVGNETLTEKYRVQNIPATILLDSQGRLLRRWDGFFPPTRFANELSNELSGKPQLAKLQQSFFPRSPSARLKLARKLHALGYQQAALDELHRLLQDPFADEWIAGWFDHFSYTRVLDEIRRIDPSELAKIRDNEKAATLADPASAAHARRFSAACNKLGDTQPVFDLFRTLPDGHARGQLHREIFPMLVQRRDYAEAVATLKNVDHALGMAARIREPDFTSRCVLRVFSPTGRAMKKLQLRAVTRRAVFFEAYAGAQRIEESRTIAAAILAWDRLGSSPAVLRQTAQEALGPEAESFIAALNLPALSPPVVSSK